jgi:hypothetical protein
VRLVGLRTGRKLGQREVSRMERNGADNVVVECWAYSFGWRLIAAESYSDVAAGAVRITLRLID